jgi:hypothetical protein
MDSGAAGTVGRSGEAAAGGIREHREVLPAFAGIANLAEASCRDRAAPTQGGDNSTFIR